MRTLQIIHNYSEPITYNTYNSLPLPKFVPNLEHSPTQSPLPSSQNIQSYLISDQTLHLNHHLRGNHPLVHHIRWRRQGDHVAGHLIARKRHIAYARRGNVIAGINVHVHLPLALLHCE